MRHFLFFYLLFCTAPLFSQNILGNWRGSISVNGNDLPIVFHFYKDSSGKLDGKWDSPNQKAMNLPFSGVNVDGDSVHLTIKLIGGSYEGKFRGNDSIEGMWHQGGGAIALNVSRTNEKEEVQNILRPNEKEISITSTHGSKIFGTLLSKNTQQKMALIIAGSGPTDRNGNNPLGVDADSYKMLADALDSQNIASFRFDKFGIAKSMPPDFDQNNLVFEDYIKDADRIISYLHDSIGFKNVYIIGHSEGSLIGMVAAQNKNVKGFISLAGAGRPIDVVIEQQLKEQSLPDSLQSKAHYIFNLLKQGKFVKDTEIPQPLLPLFQKTIQPYMISWLAYSPQKEIKKLKCPVLIINGTCDIQVRSQDANNLHSAALKSTLDIIPMMTHTLKNAGKNCEGQQETYTDNKLPLNYKLVKDIVGFINAK